MTNRYRTRRGFTLIETLVAMVVLLIGILALVSLFPPGFLVLQQTNEITIAQVMAQQQISDLRKMPAPPTAVLSALPDQNGNIVLLNGAPPDDLNPASLAELTQLQQQYNFTLPAGFLPYFYSDVNRIRFIQGEQFPVPVPAPGIDGSIHILQYGPVYNVFHTVNGNLADSISVHGPPMTRDEEDSQTGLNNPNPNPNLKNLNEYAIDYGHDQISFYPHVVPLASTLGIRNFNMSFSAFDSIAGVYTTQSVTITVPDVYPGTPSVPVQPLWQPIPPVILGNGQTAVINPYSETVSRAYRLISSTPGPNPPFDSDPYEYAWLSPQEPNNVNRGVLLFNPLGHVSQLDPYNPGDTQALSSSQVQGLTAYVDYLTYDNHIIRDDRSISNQAPYVTKLSLGGIRSKGDILSDQTTYNGLYHNDPADASPDEQDVAVEDLTNGAIIAQIVSGASVQLYNGVPRATLDAKNGIITFNSKYIQNYNLENEPVRILYRAQRSWGFQLQKAAAFYNVVSASALSSPGAFTSTSCWVGDGTNGSSTTRIYFSPSEAGKTINIGDMHYTILNPNPNNPYLELQNLTLPINDNTAFFTNINGNLYTWADITSQIPNAVSLTAIPTGRAIDYVQGVSARARIVWRDPVTNNFITWHHVDADTILSSSTP